MLIVLAVTSVFALVLSAACRLYYLSLVRLAYLDSRDPSVLDKGAEVLKSWPQRAVALNVGRPKPAIEAEDEGSS